MKKAGIVVPPLLLLTIRYPGLAGEVIPIKVERNKTMVTVKVGETEIPNIVLDTGFTSEGLMVYSPEYLGALDLSAAREIRVSGAGSGEASRALLLESSDFILGGVQMTNQRLIVLQSDTFKGFPSRGILGYSVFGRYAVELDYDRYQVTLHEPEELEVDDSWGFLPLYFKDNRIPWADVSVVVVDEPPILLSTYIDFAAGDALVLLEKPGMRFQLPAETVDVHIGRGLSGDIYGRAGRIAKLWIGTHELRNVKASFAAAEVRSKQENADAILGNTSLRRFNLIFDYAHRRLYLRPNSHFAEPFE